MSDIFYYNISVGNNSLKEAGSIYGTSKKAIIEAKANIPICQNPEDYYCSIVRFSIPMFNVPIAYMLIQIDQSTNTITDINKTVYSFTIADNSGNSSSQVFIQHVPEIKLPKQFIPLVGTPTQTFNEYYFIYAYTHLIYTWNTALEQAIAEYNTAAGTTLKAPFFFYDATTQLISLYTKNLEFNTLTSPVKIYFNTRLETFLAGINIKYLRTGLEIDGKENYIVINNVNGLNLNDIHDISGNILDPSGTVYQRTTFDFNSYGYYNFLKRILITTNMNVTSEIFSINNLSETVNNQQNINYVNVITDYIPDLSIPNGAGIAQQLFTYNAPSLYRMFEFKQKDPLYNISLQILLEDNYDNLYPLWIDSGMSATFKFMFIKKSVYNTMNIKALKN